MASSAPLPSSDPATAARGPYRARPALRVLEPSPPYGSPPEVPDPFDDPDALEELGEQIATLAAEISAAEHRMLELIEEFDRRRGWELGGHRSCAHWLAYRTKMDLHTARERVRAARALADLPRTGASMARGELSFSAVRALTRVATPENEEDLLELARGCTTAQLERVLRAVRLGGAKDEAARARVMHSSRTFSVIPGDDGMYVVRGRLTPEVGALLMRAVEAASDALYRERELPGTPEADTARAAARLRADAVGLLAERALAAGFGGGHDTPEEDAEDVGEADGVMDAHDDVPAGTFWSPASSPAPISGTRAERYQVLLHVDPRTLANDEKGGTAGPGRSHFHDGTRVPAGTSRRLACDAAVVRVAHGSDGSILNVGRRTRSIPPALRRALEVRDRGCRFPGCGLRFTDAHHVVHWADGGETSLSNTVLLCRHHHRLVHEGGWTVRWWGEGRPVFFDPRGGSHYDGRTELQESPSDDLQPRRLLDALVERNRRRGAAPDGWTAAARWKREEDIPDRVLFEAMEAAGG